MRWLGLALALTGTVILLRLWLAPVPAADPTATAQPVAQVASETGDVAEPATVETSDEQARADPVLATLPPTWRRALAVSEIAFDPALVAGLVEGDALTLDLPAPTGRVQARVQSRIPYPNGDVSLVARWPEATGSLILTIGTKEAFGTVNRNGRTLNLIHRQGRTFVAEAAALGGATREDFAREPQPQPARPVVRTPVAPRS